MTKKRLFRNTRKPSPFQGKLSFLLPLICKSKPNFSNPRTTLTTSTTITYINLHPQNHKKSKPNPNPIQTQFPYRVKVLRRPKPWQSRDSIDLAAVWVACFSAVLSDILGVEGGW